MRAIRTWVAASLWLAVSAAALTAQQADPYIWLENVEGERALEWVEARNASTLDVLTAQPVYQPMFDRALSILDSDDRIAYPTILAGRLYNFWQDSDNPRGVWRRTTWAQYLAGDPSWETVLDIDILARDEDVPWAYAGATCLPPDHQRCLVRLSRGGADAVEVREFDLGTRRFIDGGFFLPEAKQSVAWVDRNTLLVATDFGEGTMTESGYARMARVWQSGDAAVGGPDGVRGAGHRHGRLGGDLRDRRHQLRRGHAPAQLLRGYHVHRARRRAGQGGRAPGRRHLPAA
jgi:prolyl oligopeptidase